MRPSNTCLQIASDTDSELFVGSHCFGSEYNLHIRYLPSSDPSVSVSASCFADPLSEAFLSPHPTKLAATIVSAKNNAKFFFFIHFSSFTSFFEFRFTKKIFSVFFTHSIIITDSIILFVYYVKILTAFFYCFIIF